MSDPKISINADLCTRCELCLAVCSRNNIEMGKDGAQIRNPARCMLCGHCKSVCPVDAPMLHALDADEFTPVPDTKEMPEPDRLLSFFRSRRSIRAYKPIPVSRAELEMMVAAGRSAPTGGNRQPVRYLMINTPEMIANTRTMVHAYLAGEAEKIFETDRRHRETGSPLPERWAVRMGYAPLWKSMGRMYEKGRDLLFYHAPTIVVLHADPEASSPFCADIGLAAMQMVLMAQSLGVGTCFCGFLVTAINNCQELKDMLKIPNRNKAVLTFMAGYPDVSYLRTAARQPADVRFL